MASQGIARFLNRLQSAPPEPVSLLFVPGDRVLDEHGARVADEPDGIRAGRDYFTVRMTAVRLAEGRGWFKSYLPMVATGCEFTYKNDTTAVPFVVGPSLVAPAGGKLPPRMLLRDTRVCGIHPYRGGEVAISAMLCRVVADDRLARIVGMIEQASKVLNVAATVAPYLALVNVVTGTVDDMAADGDAQPLLAGRLGLSQDNGTFRPGRVLITAGEVDADQVWVTGGEVHVGRTREDAVELTADHVLLSIERVADRSDAETLPDVDGLWQRVVEFSGRPDAESWSAAKTWLSALSQHLALSPDLTRPQAELLYKTYVQRAVERRDEARQLGELGKGEDEDELQILRNIDHAVRAL